MHTRHTNIHVKYGPHIQSKILLTLWRYLIRIQVKPVFLHIFVEDVSLSKPFSEPSDSFFFFIVVLVTSVLVGNNCGSQYWTLLCFSEKINISLRVWFFFNSWHYQDSILSAFTFLKHVFQWYGATNEQTNRQQAPVFLSIAPVFLSLHDSQDYILSDFLIACDIGGTPLWNSPYNCCRVAWTSFSSQFHFLTVSSSFLSSLKPVGFFCSFSEVVSAFKRKFL